jgi:hypothetical protein
VRSSSVQLETLAIELTIDLWMDNTFILTVHQTETAIKLLENASSHRLTNWLNLMVALCMNPWLVDVKVGRHGVCYFGNYGETPKSMEAAFAIVRYNFQMLHRRYHLLVPVRR